ncbi:hypothetical protein MASR1M12_22960 [Erysipelotrichia bacterium]
MREFAAALILSRLKGVGAATFRRMLEEHGSPSAALRHWRRYLKTDPTLTPVSLRKASTRNLLAASIRLVRSGELLGWYFLQPGYPPQLADLGEPPPVIFASSLISQRRFAAVVGARSIEPEAVALTESVCRHLIAQGYAIVSGGASGVDTVAHRTALDSGVYTIAVLGTGLDVIYPAANAGLFTEIRKNGALMTELMPGARPARSFFPTRNRIIAAMAETVIVVQAAAGSGSMITANWAARLGRNVMTILPPSGKENAVAWEGNRILLNSGARPVLPG